MLASISKTNKLQDQLTLQNGKKAFLTNLMNIQINYWYKVGNESINNLIPIITFLIKRGGNFYNGILRRSKYVFIKDKLSKESNFIDVLREDDKSHNTH